MPSQTQIRFDIQQAAYRKISEALQEHADHEIGGILIGYRERRNNFSITEATVADDIGTFGPYSFIREPMKSVRALVRAFKKRKHNYVGEWHSHPKFILYPSEGDIATMRGILVDPRYSVSFALLVLAKINNGRLDMAGYLFHRSLPDFARASITYDMSPTA